VDTTPSTGDIYKMLIGSINENIDGQNDPVPEELNGQAHDNSANALGDANYRTFLSPTQSRELMGNASQSSPITILPSRPPLASPMNEDSDFVFTKSLH
jgi:hypothetical protein